MDSENVLTFTELRSKDIINSTDGKRLGRACDLVFDTVTGKIKGIISPYGKRSCFVKGQDIFIPFKCIQKFGEDIVLVDVNCNTAKTDKTTCTQTCLPACPPVEKCVEQTPCPVPSCPPRPNCDMRCEKCMLFDCAYRWKNN